MTAMAIPAAKSIGEKVAEKVVEKRRALGRGLESLLPGGPRVVAANDPTLAQSARKAGAPSEDLAAAVLREVRGQHAPSASSGQALAPAGRRPALRGGGGLQAVGGFCPSQHGVRLDAGGNWQTGGGVAGDGFELPAAAEAAGGCTKLPQPRRPYLQPRAGVAGAA